MTRREFVVGSGAAACVAAVAGCRTAARQAAEDAAQRELEKQVDDGLIAGGVCAVVGGDVHVAGKMRRPPMSTPMRADALFDLASAAKPFTASLCAILYTQGRLDPDAPFTEYLPQHVLAKENHGITVRDLATHSGGFDNSKPYIVPDANEFNRLLYQKRPVRPRGEKYDYACSNMIYLGRIVENLTGLDLETAAMRMLWEPLGMRDTFWHNIPGNVRAVETEQNGHPPIGVKGDEQARAYPGGDGQRRGVLVRRRHAQVRGRPAHPRPLSEGLLRPPLHLLLREGRRAPQLRLGHVRRAASGGLERGDDLPRGLYGQHDRRRSGERLCGGRPHQPHGRPPQGLCRPRAPPLADERVWGRLRGL